MAFSSFVGATVADAAVLRATFTGTVGSGTDQLGLFGTSGADLTGQSGTMSFLFDSALGLPLSGAPVVDGVSGGTVDGAASPVLSAEVTIGGQTVTSGANSLGSAAILAGPAIGQGANYSAWGADPLGLNTTRIGAYFYGPGVSLPGHVDTPYTIADLAMIAAQPGSAAMGQADYRVCLTSALCHYTNLLFSWNSVTVAPEIAAVPLPATAFLLAAGLGGLGVARRRAKRAG